MRVSKSKIDIAQDKQ